MADELKMLEELEALEKQLPAAPWSWARKYGLEEWDENGDGLHWCLENPESAKNARTISFPLVTVLSTREYLGVPMEQLPEFRAVVEFRNALPTLIRLARRGLAAGEVVEVVKEYLDGGNIIAPSRLDAALSRLAEMEER